MFELIDQQAIRRGVAFLDVKIPEWRDRIHVDTLNMGIGTMCAIGQLAGFYVDYIVAMLRCPEFTDFTSIEHLGSHLGFDIPRDIPWRSKDAAYEELTRAWLLEVATLVPA